MRLPDWLQKRKWLFIPVGVAVGVGLAVGSHYVPWPEGFGLKGKTFWDWLSLLGVPLSLALLGLWFQRQEKQRDKEATEAQRKIAEDAAKEEVLQVYFDRISTLLVEKNLRAIADKVYCENDEGSDAQRRETVTLEQQELLKASIDVIRARTLSILRRFETDGKLKGIVIQFLTEAEIIKRLKLDLSGANLSLAHLVYADLRDVKLILANLSEANLSEANLSGADLSFANLSKANLRDADLKHTIFNEHTVWPNPNEVAKAKNIPVELKKKLGLSAGEA